ncbi:hypothetical protein PV08_09238 [Exophiala spinifera]|uniref:Uncharacterized protein n=1 Tax=Exophiala spinifera TaxID=91928 RepID=A0A0D2BL84_9EURO|nr:uncharacterized protein PV08_09238 [Exophiala spinifera]KIW11964.1 hypothetical protein PV08_09238 [Exophiala spinifera]
MSPVLGSLEGQAANAAQGMVLDPISRQILERTQSSNKLPSGQQSGVVPSKSTYADPGPSEDLYSGRMSSDPAPLRRVDSGASNKLTKDKKKGVSFLSRIMGGPKKRDVFDVREDTISEFADDRSPGVEAEVFSQPLGHIPKFPAPPRYIKVKTQHRKEKELDRLFLAQIALEAPKPKSRRRLSIDSKIHDITDNPTSPSTTLTSTGNSAIWAMEFSKDGKYLAAAGQDKKLRVWEVISSTEEREFEEKLAESGKDGNKIKLNAPVFKTKLAREYDGHTSSVLDLSWSKNNFLLSSSMDKTVRLYHVSRAECLCAFKHNDFVTSIQFHPRDDRFFLAGSLDSKLRLWSIPDKTVAFWAQVPDMVTAVAFTPDGKTAIAGCLNGLCILYDTEGLKAHSQIHVRSARGKNAKGSKITGIDTIALPRDNANTDVKLLITSNDSRIRMYNLKDRTLEVKFRGNENTCSQIHASFSDDGKYVICGSEDRKVYIWPTSEHERPDNEKRPMEVFEAHSAIVTTALLAPERTRRLLAQSGDPLYDLCNPPPVTLFSRADSVISSRAPTNNSSDEKNPIFENRLSGSPKRAPESPAFLARHSHPGGQIIVTADYTGQIKVFRQDCAFQKRKHESWDAGSSFSRKMLGRSASVNTRTSGTSSTHRNSFVMGSKTQSTDRILSWRNSVSATAGGNPPSASLVEIRGSMSSERSRSASPKKLISHRLSLRKASPPTKNGILSPTSPTFHSPLNQMQNGPSIAVTSPTASSHTQKTPDYEKHFSPTDFQPIRTNPSPSDLPHNDPLLLMDQQSFLAWDIRNTLLPMAKHIPRTPGVLGPDGNPLSRAESYVSQLSSEIAASDQEAHSAGASVDGDNERARNNRKSRSRRRSSASSEGELRCRNCRGKAFKVTMGQKGQTFRCKKCGTVV